MKIRCIHVGVGGRGAWPVKLIPQRDDFESVAFVDVQPANLAEARKLNPQVPPERCFARMEDALEKVEADAVIIITPPQVHYGQCLTAVRAGKHVFVEKPFALHLDHAREIVGEANMRKLKICVGQNALYNGANATFARLVREKTYGRVANGLVTKFGWRPKVHHSGTMRHAYLWERGVHDFDTIRAVFGEEVRRVSALAFNPPWSPYAHGAGNHAWLEFESGAVCGYSCSFAVYAQSISMQLDCEQASLVEANKEKKILVWKPGAKEPESLPWDPAPSPETILLDGWSRYIRDGVEPRFSGRENLKTIALCEAVGMSADRGCIIEVDKLLKPQ